MKTIIAGSRTFTNYKLLEYAVAHCGWEITEVISGEAAGADKSGERWAYQNKVPIKRFPAKWWDLKQPRAVIKTSWMGKPFNANAGHYRNQEMANYAEAVILLWDGTSPGTKSMCEKAHAKGLPIYIVNTLNHTCGLYHKEQQ